MAIACRLASSSRVGLTSVAAMLADVSIRKMNRSPISSVPFHPAAAA